MKDYETTQYEKEESVLKGIIIVGVIAVLGISAWALSLLVKSTKDVPGTETRPAVTEPYVEPAMNQNPQPGGWQPAPPPNDNNGGYPAPPPPPEWGGNQPPMNQQPMG